MSEEIPEMHLNPMKVFMELEELLPSDAVLVADGGDFVATAAYILRWANFSLDFFFYIDYSFNEL